MQKITSIGRPDWSVNDIKKSVREFLELYEHRPLHYNPGGMRTPHMFATWFITRQIKPKYIVESGVLYGQGTWLLEKAVPDAQIICIEPNLKQITYKSKKAIYTKKDFNKTNWADLPKEDALLFFDDHQNAFQRLKVAQNWGFKHMIFEDNYPADIGDCYSLKKVFSEVGFTPDNSFNLIIKRFVRNLLGKDNTPIFQKPRPQNSDDMEFLKENVEIYYEFPPVFKSEFTRWGDKWDDKYFTPEPLFAKLDDKDLEIFYNEAKYYTWLCYVKLKN